MEKGGVVFHHGTALHTSHQNNSERWRRAYATHWVSARQKNNVGWTIPM